MKTLSVPMQTPNPTTNTLATAYALFACVAWLRLNGTGWDEFANLHPDERHLMFVVTDMLARWNESTLTVFDWPQLWFATGHSPFDPRIGGGFYVYGEAPVLMLTVAAATFNLGGWIEILEFGRLSAALVDSMTVLVVFMLTFRMSGSAQTSLLSGILYAAAPTAQQVSNFYTVDVFVSAGVIWAAFFSYGIYQASTLGQALNRSLLAGGFAGAAVACKLPGLVIGLPILIVILQHARSRGIWPAVLITVTIGFSFLLSIRLLNPFAFSGPGLLHVTLDSGYISDVKELLAMAASPNFPPNWQWQAGYSWVHFVRDFALFGCGPIAIILLLCGIGKLRFSFPILFLLSLILPLLAITLISQSSAMRYASPALSALSILSALVAAKYRSHVRVAAAIAAIWWGSGSYYLHTNTHPRVEASRWLWQLPKRTTLANETAWDEALPVTIKLEENSSRRWPSHDDHFQFITLDVTAADTVEKANQLARKLAKTDYLVISSNRHRSVMPRFPERFPMMTKYYELIDSGALCFEAVWERESVYPLPFFPFADGWAQEPWRVYDHPHVKILKKESCFDEKVLREKLSDLVGG